MLRALGDTRDTHMIQALKLLPAVATTSQAAIARGLEGRNADKWARVLVRMALLRDLTWGVTPKGGK